MNYNLSFMLDEETYDKEAKVLILRMFLKY